MSMDDKKLEKKIAEFVDESIKGLKEKIGENLESITLTGSYVTGNISLERPNVNMILFFKERSPPDAYLGTGDVFYSVAKDYLDYFSVRVSLFPFRFAQPIGEKDLELSVTSLLLDMGEKDLELPFGIAPQVLQGMKRMREVRFGDDILGELEFDLTKEDIVKGALNDLPLYKLQLLRAPLTYDINENYDLLATEALEVGKVSLYMGMELFLAEPDIEEEKHLKLVEKKGDLKDFYSSLDEELHESVSTILEARSSFLDFKRNKEKAFELYRSAYIVLNSTLGEAFKLKREVLE